MTDLEKEIEKCRKSPEYFYKKYVIADKLDKSWSDGLDEKIKLMAEKANIINKNRR